MRKVIEECPTCGGTLEVREMACPACATTVRSRYQLCDFCRLTAEQVTFVRQFVLSRGNLSEMEKFLGVSYPTVRAKLEEISTLLRADQPVARPVGRGQERQRILQRVQAGELTAIEGLAMLSVKEETV